MRSRRSPSQTMTTAWRPCAGPFTDYRLAGEGGTIQPRRYSPSEALLGVTGRHVVYTRLSVPSNRRWRCPGKQRRLATQRRPPLRRSLPVTPQTSGDRPPSECEGLGRGIECYGGSALDHSQADLTSIEVHCDCEFRDVISPVLGVVCERFAAAIK